MLSFKAVIICSVFITISYGKEFILYDGSVGGADNADVTWMEDKCKEINAEPATIETAEENAKAHAACYKGTHCFFGLVRDDPTTINWYWRDGEEYSYAHWGAGEGVAQAAGGEQCVVMLNSADTWHDYPCGHQMHLICQTGAGDGCDAVDIDGFLIGCSDEFATTNGQISANSGLISDNADAIQANTNLINSKSAANNDEIKYLEERLDRIADFQAAHAGPAGMDEFGNNASVFNSNDAFLIMSLMANIMLVLSMCYMVNKTRKSGYNKVKMYESDVDQPLQ